MTWPRYLIDRALRPAPANCAVVDGSTPVVAFGNPLASVATLAINPSSREFLESDGRPLAGDRRRLASRNSLDARYEGRLTEQHAVEVVDECAEYFQRRPYRWFNPLDRVLREGLDRSYWDGTACHLDLVQWATNPIWGQLSPTQQQTLLRDDEPFLIQQLGQSQLKLVLVNGRTALNGVESAGVVEWTHIDRIAPPAGPTVDLYRAEAQGCRFLGWSANLQAQGGHHAGPTLGAVVRAHAPSELTAEDASADDEGPLSTRGRRCLHRDEFIAVLEDWLASTHDQTIGDVGNFAGAAWLHFTSSVGEVQLNADTTREAVTRVVQHYRSSSGAPWIVVANQRGRTNRVLIDGDARAARGWYAYLKEPRSAGTEVS